MDICKLIVGVNNASAVTVIVSDGPAASMPDLVATGNGRAAICGTYNQSTQKWTLSLPAGDHMLRIDVPENDFPSGELTITCNDAVNFVYFGPASSDTTVAWTDTTAVGRGDPKDPWPPPGSPSTTLSGASFAWHDSVLRGASALLPKDAQLWFDERVTAATSQ